MRSSRQIETGIFLALMAFAAWAVPAAAQENCTGFAWPLETEVAWMTAPDAQAADSGAKLPAPAAGAVAVKLQPSKQVNLPFKPGTKKAAIAPDSYSGWIEIAALPKAGLYQITLSANGWIDAVQNGEAVASQAFTGARECKAVRKSVRYELGTGPLTIQVSGVPVETVRIAIREAN